VDLLRHEGFAAATARAIAARAGCNQGLVFYYFGSVVDLLLVALDEVSDQRRRRYEEALAGVGGLGELVELAARIFAEDLESGDAALLVEMIAGATSTPGLGAEVKARLVPWTHFAAAALEPLSARSPLAGWAGADEFAHAMVALYLGLELLSHLDGDSAPALALFERARRLSPLLDMAGLSAGKDGPGSGEAGPGSRKASLGPGPDKDSLGPDKDRAARPGTEDGP
jgi:AcrR family transcriptional regulator